MRTAGPDREPLEVDPDVLLAAHHQGANVARVASALRGKELFLGRGGPGGRLSAAKPGGNEGAPGRPPILRIRGQSAPREPAKWSGRCDLPRCRHGRGNTRRAADLRNTRRRTGSRDARQEQDEQREGELEMGDRTRKGLADVTSEYFDPQNRYDAGILVALSVEAAQRSLEREAASPGRKLGRGGPGSRDGAP